MQYINKKAFDRGFKDFKSGSLWDNPYDAALWDGKEWMRGQNYAFSIVLGRNLQRERYRKTLNA